MKVVRWLLLVALLATAVLVRADGAPPGPVTKEALRQRIAELDKMREQAIANVNAISGAIQECEHWMAVIEEREKAQKEKPGKEEKKK